MSDNLLSSGQELLLLVFIHGFRGTNSTFHEFPDRLKEMLSESIDNVVIDPIVFPKHNTKGRLTSVVKSFSNWLKKLVPEKEAAHKERGGTGKAKIVLCSHSMGGLIAADALIKLVHDSWNADAPLHKQIIACLAFDTPYLGVHSNVAAHILGKVKDKVLPITRKRAAGVGIVVGVLLLAQSAAVASMLVGIVTVGAIALYFKRDNKKVKGGYMWVKDHIKYVWHLYNEDELYTRLDNIIGFEKRMGILFRTFYTTSPPDPPPEPKRFRKSKKTAPSTDPNAGGPRTFIVLPKETTVITDKSTEENAADFATHFLAAHNGKATDVIEAHKGMFQAATNDGYDQLESETSRMIEEAVMLSRRGVAVDEKVK